ncbi:MAG: hypothetical protein J1E65_02645 [Lachnospiraceae bacterium]|nr:hypothetical protein [Lachnospiraceae bacterium]
MNMKKGFKKGIALVCSFSLALQLAACGEKAQPDTKDIGTDYPGSKAIWTGDPDTMLPLQNGGGSSNQSGSQSLGSLNGSLAYFEGLEKTGEVYSQTIMVYVVGSDLESRYGSATMDLVEMEEAGVDTENNNIVVYLGGAEDWSYPGVSGDKTTMMELGKDGFEVIDTTSRKNMGKSSTLSDFINFCLENYDTDKYGLILWDHGAGPVFGFGVDENYNDILSLQEMQTALENSVGKSGNKLEWIGFDACLMNSLEIAAMLSPYADFMIASQETEPGWGWNYEFLSYLSEPDMDGARLGKEIVDSYMEYGEKAYAVNPRLYADLTLSCIDLNRYQAAEDALNAFFREMDSLLDVNTFPAIVRNRNDVRDFGSYSSDYNYSLVDVRQLLDQFSGASNASADDAISAITSMIVYTRSNVDEAEGISICYPYQAEDDYTDYYIEWQEAAGFAPDYVNFLHSFYEIESGDQLTSNWNLAKAVTDVETVDVAEAEAQTQEYVSSAGLVSDISLALTEEQQQNFGKASYMILGNLEGEDYIDADKDERAGEMYLYIHSSSDVQMDENGVLHAFYSNSVIYMEEEGELSPLPMILIEKDSTETERRYLAYGILSRWEEDFTYISDVAMLQIVVNDEYPNGFIRSAVPTSNEDEDSDFQNPSKQLLNLEDYEYISFGLKARYITRDENGQLLPYFDWEVSDWFMGFDQDLQKPYSLTVQPLQRPQNYYCIFYVTDAQGNVSVSEMIPLG